MTKEQKIEAFTMRLDGMSYQAIADKYGVSRQYIQQMLIGGSRRNQFKKWEKDFIYPNLYAYMSSKGFNTLKKISEHLELGITPFHLGKRFKGEVAFRIEEILKIIEITGMSFEEAFKKEE